jgi:hypothetical protein
MSGDPRPKAPKMATTEQQRRRAAETARYNRWVSIELSLRTRCEAGDILRLFDFEGCTGRAVLIHHRRRRSQGGALMSRVNSVSACGACHDYLHSHPEQAKQVKQLLTAGDPEWDQCGKEAA